MSTNTQSNVIPDLTRTIVFNNEIHPLHIIRHNLHRLGSDFAWFVRDSNKNGIVHIDFVRNTKVSGLGKTTHTWDYYSIPFCLINKKWELINTENVSELKNLTPIDSDTAVYYLQKLFEKLQTLKLKDLNLAPEIPELLMSIVDDNGTNSTTIKIEDMKFVPEFRLYPSARQAHSDGIFDNCSAINLETKAAKPESDSSANEPEAESLMSRIIRTITGRKLVNDNK